MKLPFAPLHLRLGAVAGWVNRHQAEAIVHLREENRVLREQLRGKRLRLTDDQRRRLAAKGRVLGRRRLIAAKWTDAAKKRTGRPGVLREIEVARLGESCSLTCPLAVRVKSRQRLR